jgi:hypothetical protein
MMKPDQEHEDLARLFEATAASASAPVLTRLAVQAAQIPEDVRAKRRSLWRWAWLPAFASAAAVAVAVLARLTTSVSERPAISALSSSVLAVASSAEVSMASDVAPLVPSDVEDLEGAELIGDDDEGEHFDVTRPQSDRDLDGWLAAAKEVSGS